MKNLKKSIKKMRKRRRKTYKGGAAAQDNAKYISLAKQILEIKHQYAYAKRDFTPEQIEQFSVHLREKIPEEGRDNMEFSDFLSVVSQARDETLLSMKALDAEIQVKGIIVPEPPQKFRHKSVPNNSSPAPTPENQELSTEEKLAIATQVLYLLGYGINKNYDNKSTKYFGFLLNIDQRLRFASLISTDDFDRLDKIIDKYDLIHRNIKLAQTQLLNVLFENDINLVEPDKDNNFELRFVKDKIRKYI